MEIYEIKDTDIVYSAAVDFGTRTCSKEVHIVQYDNSLPIVAVKLYSSGGYYALPAGYEANLRFSKKDKTFIYKPVLGCDKNRTTVYFVVDEQMSLIAGDVYPIIELTYNGSIVGSSPITFVIDRNPIQIGDIESKSDYPAIVERISAAETKATNAKTLAEEAKASADDARDRMIDIGKTYATKVELSEEKTRAIARENEIEQQFSTEAIIAASLSGSGTNTVTLSTTKGGTTSTSFVIVNNVNHAADAETADYATKATQDASGNTITSYYLPKANATSKGSATQPVYFNSSGVATPTTYQLNATVPSGAVFTDTKNTAGATNNAANTLYLIGATSQDANPQTYSNSKVFVTSNGGVTATNFVRTGGTSAQFLKADGSIDSTSYIDDGALVNTVNPFNYDGAFKKLYNGWLENDFFSANLKWFVTLTFHKQTDDSGTTYPYADTTKAKTDKDYWVDGPITGTVQNLSGAFDGNFESPFTCIAKGLYAKVHIQPVKTINFDTSDDSDCFSGYTYGFFIIGVYDTWYSEKIVYRTYNKYAPQGCGWKIANFSNKGSTRQTMTCWDLSNFSRNCMEFLIFGPAASDTKTECWPTQMCWIKTRTTINNIPVLNNYREQYIYHPFYFKVKDSDGTLQNNVVIDPSNGITANKLSAGTLAASSITEGGTALSSKYQAKGDYVSKVAYDASNYCVLFS